VAKQPKAGQLDNVKLSLWLELSKKRSSEKLWSSHDKVAIGKGDVAEILGSLLPSCRLVRNRSPLCAPSSFNAPLGLVHGSVYHTLLASLGIDKVGSSRLQENWPWHPLDLMQVLSLAEFFWPCILFMILTVLRFQEPPRHRDNCFLQARDLPSRGVLPFVQGLLCNTGSSCRNISFETSMDHHFRYEKHKYSFKILRMVLYAVSLPSPQIPQLLQHHVNFMHVYSSRFQTATDDSQVSSLAFLKEIQDLAEDILETMDKAKSLQKLWLKRSETSGKILKS
ncbi:ATP-binding cassette sub-family A member 13, partial [Lemmus lemmus]